jgi:hypothetical protein
MPNNLYTDLYGILFIHWVLNDISAPLQRLDGVLGAIVHANRCTDHPDSVSPSYSPGPFSMSGTDEDEDEQFAEQALIEAVENQLLDGQPPAVKAVLNRLCLVGYTHAEAVRMMAMVLAHEVSAMLRDERTFNVEHYERSLRALPNLPEDA